MTMLQSHSNLVTNFKNLTLRKALSGTSKH